MIMSAINYEKEASEVIAEIENESIRNFFAANQKMIERYLEEYVEWLKVSRNIIPKMNNQFMRTLRDIYTLYTQQAGLEYSDFVKSDEVVIINTKLAWRASNIHCVSTYGVNIL